MSKGLWSGGQSPRDRQQPNQVGPLGQGKGLGFYPTGDSRKGFAGQSHTLCFKVDHSYCFVETIPRQKRVKSGRQISDYVVV